MIRIIEATAFSTGSWAGTQVSPGAFLPSTYLHHVSRIFTQAIGLQIQRQVLVSQRRKRTWGKEKEGEGETDRRWLSWAVIFWEPVLRLPGAIFKRPTSPSSPGGCRGERRGLCAQTQALDTQTCHITNCSWTRRTHKHKSKQRPWGKTQPQSQEDMRQGRMQLISIQGPFHQQHCCYLLQRKHCPQKETHANILDANLNVCMCHRVHIQYVQDPFSRLISILVASGLPESCTLSFIFQTSIWRRLACGDLLYNSDYRTGSVAIGSVPTHSMQKNQQRLTKPNQKKQTNKQTKKHP